MNDQQKTLKPCFIEVQILRSKRRAHAKFRKYCTYVELNASLFIIYTDTISRIGVLVKPVCQAPTLKNLRAHYGVHTINTEHGGSNGNTVEPHYNGLIGAKGCPF
jgi:hypothetical protein